MKVVTARERLIDLSNSVLTTGEYREQFMAQPEGKQPIVKVNGCGLVDEDERLQPLVSTYISLNLRKKQIAFASVKSYASRLSLLLQDLKTNVEFEGCYRDDAFLSVTIGRLETYLANLAANGLAPKTIQTRDAAHLHFFSKFLCRSFDGQPALREDNPYEDGMLWTGKANTLGIVQPSSLSELEQLILHALSERERCLIQAVYDSGTRVSEVPRITLQAVRDALDFHKLRFVAASGDFPLQPDYCPLHIAGSKGRRDQIKPRITLVSRTVLERIDAYHRTPLYRRLAKKYESPETTPAFFNAQGTPHTTKSVEKLFERTSKRALKAGKIRRAISPHKLRHGGAYAILGSPDLGQSYLDRLVTLTKSYGHNSETTSEGYTLIPFDIFQKLREPNAVVKTKAGEMHTLRERTTKRIRTGDVK